MISTNALRIGVAAAVMLAGCASPGRPIVSRTPAVPSAPVASAAPSAATAPSAPVGGEPLPAVARLAVVQSAAPVRVAFRDGNRGDLRDPPPSKLGDRAKQGAGFGAMPGFALAQAGTPEAAVVGVVLAVLGGAVGAITGSIVGSVEDARDRSKIPVEKIYSYTPRLQAAGSDLVLGPLALRDCAAGQLGTVRAFTQLDVADAEESTNLALLAQRGFSHALTLDEIDLTFRRDTGGDAGEERFTATLQARYRVYELADPPRVVHDRTAEYGAPAVRLDRWAAEDGREVRELAARGCAPLAEKIASDLGARFSLAGN